MDINYYWSHPVLSPYQAQWAKGDSLFQIGDPANEAMLIASGLVSLSSMVDYKAFTVSYVGPGQFLGEQVLWGHLSGKRSFAAVATQPVQALVIGAEAVKHIEESEPKLLLNLLREVAANTAQRLQRANYLISHFRTQNNSERLAYLIVYLARAFGRQDSLGTQVSLPQELLSYYLDMPPKEMERVLSELCMARILSSAGSDAYIIRDMKLLEERAKVIKSQFIP